MVGKYDNPDLVEDVFLGSGLATFFGSILVSNLKAKKTNKYKSDSSLSSVCFLLAVKIAVSMLAVSMLAVSC